MCFQVFFPQIHRYLLGFQGATCTSEKKRKHVGKMLRKAGSKPKGIFVLFYQDILTRDKSYVLPSTLNHYPGFGTSLRCMCSVQVLYGFCYASSGRSLLKFVIKPGMAQTTAMQRESCCQPWGLFFIYKNIYLQY